MPSVRRTLFIASFFYTLLPSLGLAYTSDDYYKTGLSFYQQGNYPRAVQYLKYATQMDPNNWQAYQVLGYCYYGEKDNVQALQALDQSLQVHPDNPSLQKFDDQVRAATPGAPAAGASASSNAPPDVAPPTSSAPAETGSAASPTVAGGALNPNLPKKGKFVFELEESTWFGTWDDLNNLYGTTITSSNTPVGGKLGVGAAYAVSPNFQLGAKLQFLLKEPVQVSSNYLYYGYSETDQWNESALGGALEAEGVFPLGDGVNFIGSLEGGFYTLVGSSLNFTLSNGGASQSASLDLGGSGPGGMVSAGVELLMDSRKTWALDMGLAYQFLSISPVSASGNVNGIAIPSTHLVNSSNGSNASLDFSGIGAFVGARFF